MPKVELLLPAGSKECLRAAVNNGSDAVYLGLESFNARMSADNFNSKELPSIVRWCHQRNNKVYVALNTLIKNNELHKFFSLIHYCNESKVDAVIIQDIFLIPNIKKFFPDISIHLSTQAVITNTKSIPENINRLILPREMELEDIKKFTKIISTEIFVHGSLCISYSGLCLLSSIAGGRSGNRGLCAQPCRKKYNNKYALSTKDLCLIEKIPTLIEAGISSFKVEGRLKSPEYVAIVAKSYRRYIDNYYSISKSKENINLKVKTEDLDLLKLGFNREFTEGFAFEESILSKDPMNKGLYLGKIKNNLLRLRSSLKKGDGIAIYNKDSTLRGHKISFLIKGSSKVEYAQAGEIISLDLSNLPDYSAIYKTSKPKISLGEDLIINNEELKPPIFLEDKLIFSNNINTNNINIIKDSDNKQKIILDDAKICVNVHSKNDAMKALEEKPHLIYYDLLKDDFKEIYREAKKRNVLIYGKTPRIISDSDIEKIESKVNNLSPDGLLIGNKGIKSSLLKHFDYNFNVFNELDLVNVEGYPILSLELSFEEIKSFQNKNFIVFIHGDIIVMTTKEKIKASELVDECNRHFKIRESRSRGYYDILNSQQMGLFNEVISLYEIGIRYFYIDCTNLSKGIITEYKKILSGYKSKKGKGYTLGHFKRGVL